MTDLYKQQELWPFIGNVRTHRLTGDKLRIKKIHGTVATCESESVTIITEKPYLATNIVICKLENLV